MRSRWTIKSGSMVLGLLLSLTIWGNTAQAAPPLITVSSLIANPGIRPNGLIQASDGSLYGTCSAGGAYNEGTIFRATLSGKITDLHDFSSLTGYPGANSDGAYPQASLVQASDGGLYGTCPYGGAHQVGTVFRITTTGAFSTLYAFAGNDGANPSTGLIQAADGNLYGTCPNGGASGAGTVFKVTTAGTFTRLYSFTSGSDGFNPQAALVQATDGNLYGTTSEGGANGTGTVFRLTTAGALTTLYSFTALTTTTSEPTNTDGASPSASLIQASDGNLYGTCPRGGAYGEGTVFKITLSGTFTTLYSFGGSYGAYPDV